MEVTEFIEKPGPDKAPSDLAIVSGYLFTPDIFEALERAIPDTIDKGKELYYVDGVRNMMSDGKKVHAVEIKDAKYYDCGSKVGYLKTAIDHGLSHDDTSGELREYIKGLNL
jgi:UTP--glucose-1-phosphate uridylyltransferase